MFEIGFWELALLFALGLVVLGPEKLPKVADQLGRYAGQARRMARNLTSQIRDEMDAEQRRLDGSDDSDPPSPQPDVYSRPGADSLIPGGTPEAAGATGESRDTQHRPQA